MRTMKTMIKMSLSKILLPKIILRSLISEPILEGKKLIRNSFNKWYWRTNSKKEHQGSILLKNQQSTAEEQFQ
jgi:hypothetical protein